MAIKLGVDSTHPAHNPVQVVTTAAAVNQFAHVGNDKRVALKPEDDDCKALWMTRRIPISGSSEKLTCERKVCISESVQDGEYNLFSRFLMLPSFLLLLCS